MAKLTQFNMSDLTDVNEANSIVTSLGMDIHDPDVAVIRDVYYAIHMAKPTWRSRRRFNKALSAIREMSDGYNLKPSAKHYTRDGRAVEDLREVCGSMFGEINGKTCCWYTTGRVNNDMETPTDIINLGDE